MHVLKNGFFSDSDLGTLSILVLQIIQVVITVLEFRFRYR